MIWIKLRLSKKTDFLLNGYIQNLHFFSLATKIQTFFMLSLRVKSAEVKCPENGFIYTLRVNSPYWHMCDIYDMIELNVDLAACHRMVPNTQRDIGTEAHQNHMRFFVSLSLKLRWNLVEVFWPWCKLWISWNTSLYWNSSQGNVQFFLASKLHHKWEPCNQSFGLRVTMEPIDQFG